MNKITDITPQKKNNKRLNVYINGDFAFGISAQLKFEKRIEIGQEINNQKTQDLILSDQIERLQDKALKFLSFRPRSERETRDHLFRRGKLKEIKSDIEKSQYEISIQEVIKKLKRIGQIDDREFSKWWVEQRHNFNPRGQILLKAELRSKGIENNLIDELLQNDTEIQVQLATKAAEKKIKLYQKLDEKEFKDKIEQFLARRGFGWSVVKQAVDSILEKR